MSATITDSDIDPNRLAELATAIMGGTTDIATIQGVSNEQLEAIYALAHGHYASGDYENAQALFLFLTVYRNVEKRFWLGLAACQQMLRQYPVALRSYGICAMLDAEDPQVPLRAGECFMAMGDKTNAISALEASIIVAGGAPANAPYVARARLILGNLKSADATA